MFTVQGWLDKHDQQRIITIQDSVPAYNNQLSFVFGEKSLSCHFVLGQNMSDKNPVSYYFCVSSDYMCYEKTQPLFEEGVESYTTHSWLFDDMASQAKAYRHERGKRLFPSIEKSIEKRIASGGPFQHGTSNATSIMESIWCEHMQEINRKFPAHGFGQYKFEDASANGQGVLNKRQADLVRFILNSQGMAAARLRTKAIQCQVWHSPRVMAGS